MPSQKSLENLKRGRRFTADADDVVTKEAQRKGGRNRAIKLSMRKEALKLVECNPAVGDATMQQLKHLGIDSDDPTLQTLIIAKIGALAISKDPRIALQAAKLLMEITGYDARSMSAAEDRKLQREKIKLERRRLELEEIKVQGKDIADVPVIIDRRPE